jgi:hypothetical protein
MLEGKKIREVVEKEKPDYIVPEIEAIATDELVKLEKGGAGHSDGARRATYHGPSGHTQARGGNAEAPDLAISLRGKSQRTRSGCKGGRVSLLREADDVFKRTWSIDG